MAKKTAWQDQAGRRGPDHGHDDPGEGPAALLDIPLDLNLSLGSAADLEEAFQMGVRSCLRVPGADYAAVHLINETARSLSLAAQGWSSKMIKANAPRLDLDSQILRTVMQGETAFSHGRELAGIMPRPPDGTGLRSMTTLPLGCRGLVIGCLNIASRRGTRFPDALLMVLKILATQIGLMIPKLRAEAALRESEKSYQRLALNSPGLAFQFMLHHDGHYSFPYVSSASREMFGLEPREIMQDRKTLDKLMHPDDRERVHEAVKLSARTMEPFRTEIRHIVDGRVRWHDVNSRPERQPDGKVMWDGVMMDITERKRMEKALQEANDELEDRVRQRTAQLAQSNEKLLFELQERKRVEMTLRHREAELERKTRGLEEVNTALKVILKRREEDKNELEENVLANVNGMVAPYLEKLQATRLSAKQEVYLGIIETNLNEIISPFLQNLSAKMANLTPAEIRVAHLVRDGMTTKEMGEIMSLSPRTIETHRKNIRRKLGIHRKKGNLRSHLVNYQ